MGDLPPDPFEAPLPEADFLRWARAASRILSAISGSPFAQERGVETLKALMEQPDWARIVTAVDALDEEEARLALLTAVIGLRLRR